VAQAAALVKIPDSLSFAEAATLQSAGLTAWRGLVVEGGVKAGDIVLTLGTGGVSIYNIQLAKAHGATVIVTSSSDEKLARARQLGADFAINYRQVPDWDRQVLALTAGHGADIVLNTVGYSELERCLMACANNARLVHIGSGKASAPFAALPNLMVRNVTLKGITGGTMDIDDVRRRVDLITSRTGLPVGVGFGIRDGATARAVGEVADAVIIGTRMIQVIEDGDPAGAPERARQFTAGIRQALDAPAAVAN
jgi:NADPH:quinone reductase-like Zn-dependent oxidoreductase